MRIAVISDIHGNLQALQCVLKAIAAGGISEIWCLGDIIGYGARPWECWRIIHDEWQARIIQGNHEAALINSGGLFDFSQRAQAGVDYAMRIAPAGALEKVSFLPLALEFKDCGVALAHGSFTSDRFYYVEELSDALSELRVAPAAINFVGHTHIPMAVGQTSRWIKIDDKRIRLFSDERYLLNPGSVGQPRDKDSRAAYGILEIDGDKKFFSWHRVAYPIKEAAGEIRRAGLPESLAERLFKGK